MKFTSTGHVILCVKSVRESILDTNSRQAKLNFSVEDSGQGILANKIPVIFDKFTQVDSSLSRKHEGSGLGLAISRNLLELMGSKLLVKSEVGKGSTFWFDLVLIFLGGCKMIDLFL